MLKLLSISRVVFTVIIILVPVLHLSYMISRKLIGVFSFLSYKLFKLTVFKKIRDQIIDQEFRNERDGIDIKKFLVDTSFFSTYLEKTKTAIFFILEKLRLLFSKFIDFVKNIKLKNIERREKKIERKTSDLDEKEDEEKQVIEEIVVDKIVDKGSEFLWVKINLQSVFDEKKINEEKELNRELTLEERETILRNKKLMERILYEAFVFKKAGRFDDYEKKIIEWLAIEPEDKELNKLLAEYYFSLWNHKKALSLLKKIIDHDPRDHKAIWQIWEIYLLGQEYDVAEILIQKAISMNWNEPKYYASLVELMYNTDRKPDAVFILEQNLIKLRPNNLDYVITLADLCEELWEIQNAKKYYFRILEQDPSNEKIKRKLQKLTDETIL